MNFLYLFLWILGVVALVISFTLKKEWRVSNFARKLAQISLIGFIISLIFLIIAALLFALVMATADSGTGVEVAVVFILPLFGGVLLALISALLSIIHKGQEKPFAVIRKFVAYPILILALLFSLYSIIPGVVSEIRIKIQDQKWEQTKKITKEEAVNIALAYTAKNHSEQKNPKLVIYDEQFISDEFSSQANPNNTKKMLLRLSFSYDGSRTNERNCSTWILMDIVDGTIFDSFTSCGAVAKAAPKESIAKTNEKIDIGNNLGLIVSQPSDYTSSDLLIKPDSGMKFITLEMTYFNDSKESNGVNPSNLILQDSNNQTYKVDYRVEKTPGLKYGTVVPVNSSVKGFVAYEIPNDAKITNAVYSNSDVKITINF